MPPQPRLDVHQHLTVDAVRQAGACVRVEVADRHGSPHWISFRFSDTGPAERHAARLEAWQLERTPLTYVRSPGRGSLVDDAEMFRLSYESV